MTGERYDFYSATLAKFAEHDRRIIFLISIHIYAKRKSVPFILVITSWQLVTFMWQLNNKHGITQGRGVIYSTTANQVTHETHYCVIERLGVLLISTSCQNDK